MSRCLYNIYKQNDLMSFRVLCIMYIRVGLLTPKLHCMLRVSLHYMGLKLINCAKCATCYINISVLWGLMLAHVGCVGWVVCNLVL